MELLLTSLEFTARLVFKMGSIMFISLFGIELLLQMGLMTYFKPIGKPVAKLARLPSESALCFLTGIGSMIAAHMMTARFYEERKLTFHELMATGVLNTVPFHFKETLSFQIPIVLPLLGPELCLVYIAAFWLAGLVKLFFVVCYGRLCIQIQPDREDAFQAMECDPDDPDCVKPGFKQLVRNTWHARKKMFIKMVSLLAVVTFIIQILIHTGMMKAIESIIVPLTNLLNLPVSVVGPISAYIFSPTIGITYMSNIMTQQLVTPYQAIVALLAGGILMIPITRLRRTLPRYTAIFGLKNGTAICILTTSLSMFSRALILIWVLLFYQ